MTGEPSTAFLGDYDTNPDRFRAGSAAPRKYGQGDIHEEVAERIAKERLSPVLDLGCGEGRLCRLLQDQRVEVVSLDSSPTMLSAVPKARILGEATKLPFKSGWFGAVAALYMLYHIPDPKAALAEARHVLRTGGLLVTATPSRHNDPELADVLPRRPSTFDSEDAPDLVRRFFRDVEVETWDSSVYLPNLGSVEEYLFGRGMEKCNCADASKRLGAPLSVTKRGSVVWGYKDG